MNQSTTARTRRGWTQRGIAAVMVLIRAGLGILTLWAIFAATASQVQHGPFAGWESRAVIGTVVTVLLLLSLLAACAALLRDGLRATGVPLRSLDQGVPLQRPSQERQVTRRTWRPSTQWETAD